MSFLATTYSSSNNGKLQPQIVSTEKSCKSRNPIQKRISPRVSNCFKLNLSSKIFKNSRSASRDRNRNLSMGNMTPNHRKSTSIHRFGFNTSGKFNRQLINSKNSEESNNYRLKNEFITS